MRWGREEQKQKQREKQQLEKKHREKQQQQQNEHQHREQPPQPQPPQPQPPPPQHHLRQQDKEGRSSSSTPFSLLAPSSWISKLKQSLTSSSSKSSSSKSQQPLISKQNHHQYLLNSPDPRIKQNKRSGSHPTSDHRRKLDKSTGARPTAATTPAGSRQVQPLSPTHPARTSSVSDHYISFVPADLDGCVVLPPRRSYERAPGGGLDNLYEAGERASDRRRRGLSLDPLGSSRADAAFPELKRSESDGLHEARERALNGRRRGLSLVPVGAARGDPALPELKRSESAKLSRIASDLTASTTTRGSPKQLQRARAGTGREEFSLFSSISDRIRPIQTTPAVQSISTASRGSRPASDSDQVQDQRRKSFSSGAGHKLRRKSKVRVHSPRVGAGAVKKIVGTAEVAEKPRKVAAGKATTAAAPHKLESFAVVKCSSDPRRDFRDSMVEMISELGMARPEELEGLLACYLSLNADEYHDVIVRVFRQVWFELILDGTSTVAPSPHPHQRASA